MLGGTDITCRAQMHPAESLEVVARAAVFAWRNAVFEDAESGAAHDCIGDVPFSGMRELFVFRDPQARAAWDSEGGTAENSNTMLHVLADSDSVTIVVDDAAEPAIAALLAAIASSLRDKSHFAGRSAA